MCDACRKHEREFVHVRQSDVNLIAKLALGVLAGIGVAAILEEVLDAG